MLPKISIVIPCYNAASTIERTVKSLISQQYPRLELILIDGQSQDDTMAIVNSYQHHFTQIVSEPDSGQANALNKGFKLATGEIWGWLCADDEFTDGALLYFAKLFENQPEIDAVSAGCRRIFADGSTFNTKPRADAMARIAYHNGIEQPSTLWRSTLHQQVGELDESYHYAFDWVWWNQLQQAGVRLLVTDRVVSCYYFSDSNKTSTGSRDLVNEMYRIVKYYGPLRGYLADVYLFIYNNFDLAGYYDKSPERTYFSWVICLLLARHNPLKVCTWVFCLCGLSIIFGKDRILAYNWNFASKQERNLCWYKQSETGSADVQLIPIDIDPKLAQLPLIPAILADRHSDAPRPRIAIDCCCFESANLDRQHLWQTIFADWSRSGFAEHILAIDRDKTAPQIEGFSYYDLPTLTWQRAGERALELQQICDREHIDLFLSTGDTIPTHTPSVALIDDFRATDLDAAKSCVIYHASKYLVTDRQIATDLSASFAQIASSDIVVVAPDIEELAVGIEQLQQPTLSEQIARRGCEPAQSCCRETVAMRIAEAIFDTYQQLQARQLACPNPIWQSFRELQIASYYHRDNFIEMQEKLCQAQQEISSMKTTKFWQMREQWFALKQRLNLTE